MDIQAYIQSGIIESYVLGIANDTEVAGLQRMQREHPEVAAAIEACEAWLAAVAERHAEPVSPPITKDRLWSMLQDVPSAKDGAQALPSKDGAPPLPKAPVRTMTTPASYIAAASLILLAGSVALNIYSYNRYAKANEQYLSLLDERNTLMAGNKLFQAKLNTLHERMQQMTSPEMLKVSLPGVAGKEEHLATVYWDKHTRKVYLFANNLPTAPAGKQYQLWALVDGKPVNAGLLKDCTELCPLNDIQAAQAFAITLEKEGGSPIPDLGQLYVMGKVPS